MNASRGMSDGQRAIWNEMQVYEAPDVRVLWDRTPTARKPHLCDHCGEEIPVGAKYESSGVIVDGLFEARKLHRFGYGYPSGCPRFRARDLAELAEDERVAK